MYQVLNSPTCFRNRLDMVAEQANFIGLNTTITLQAHEGSIPGLPDMGRALSGIQLDVLIPSFGAPGDDDDDHDDDSGKSPRFIKDATVLSSL